MRPFWQNKGDLPVLPPSPAFQAGKARLTLFVRPRRSRLVFRGEARCGGRVFPCALGAGGIKPAAEKKEGDGATPAGRFPLRGGFFRAGRENPARMGFTTGLLLPQRSWCEEPHHPDYNRPHRNSKSGLWRADPLFDLILVPGHNDAPIERGRGSGIFIHAGRTGLPATEGCIALRHEDLRWLATRLGAGSMIDIRP